MAKISLQNIGSVLKEKRRDRGIRETAKEIGISPATLSRIECGKLPDLDTFTKICKWLSVDPGEVLGFKPQQEKHKTGEFLFAHFKADKNLEPETAKALAELILVARKTLNEE